MPTLAPHMPFVNPPTENVTAIAVVRPSTDQLLAQTPAGSTGEVLAVAALVGAVALLAMTGQLLRQALALLAKAAAALAAAGLAAAFVAALFILAVVCLIDR